MKKQQIDKIKKLDLSVFEAKLRSMANQFDDLDLETGPDLLTDGEVKQLYRTVRKASHENAIIQSRKTVSVEDLPFGRFLHLIRDKSGLAKSDIAKLLNKDNSYIEKIENGQLNPLKLGTKNIADIMQLFRLTVSELITTIRAFLSLSEARPAKASAMGRSPIKNGSKERSDALTFAMDAAILAIKKKQNKKQLGEPQIDHKYIEAIKKVLKDRGEIDLLI